MDVVRLNPNGSPDTSFNGTGKAKFNIAGGYSTSMALQPDGKIVLAGGSSNPTTFLIARFTAAGAPDPTFGFKGVQYIGFGTHSAAFDIAVQPDGKIIAAGATAGGGANIDFALVRLNIDGSPDKSFDTDGKVPTDFDSADYAYAVAIQPDGKILAGGSSMNNGASFARYLPNGSPDTSFDSDGKLLVPITDSDKVRSLDVSGAGITAAICNENENAGLVLRLTPTGKLDSGTNGNGRLPFSFGGEDCVYGLASTTGRIAAVGSAHVPPYPEGYNFISEDFAIAMYENVAPPTATTNRLRNGDFATDTNRDGRPDYWTSNNRVTRTSAVAYGRGYAMRHTATDDASYTVSQTVANVGAGTPYGFNGFVNIPPTSDAFSFKLEVQWRNASNAVLGTTPIRTFSTATTGWEQAATWAKAAAGATKAEVRMVVSSLKTTLYVDDVVFRP